MERVALLPLTGVTLADLAPALSAGRCVRSDEGVVHLTLQWKQRTHPASARQRA